MKATIAILTYNGADSIDALLDTCLSQAAEDFEILVIDSGSTDGTLEAVRKRDAVRLHEDLASFHMRVLQRFVNAQHRGETDVCALQQFVPFALGASANDRAKLLGKRAYFGLVATLSLIDPCDGGIDQELSCSLEIQLLDLRGRGVVVHLLGS